MAAGITFFNCVFALLPPRESDETTSCSLPADPLAASLSGISLGSGGMAMAGPLLSPLSSPGLLEAADDSFGATGFLIPQLLQKVSPGTVAVPHLRHSAIY